MTEQKSLKRRVRARMSKTGERYTAARRQVLAKEESGATSAAPPAAPPGPTPFRGPSAASDEALRSRTGRSWQEWFAILETWGAADRTHPEIARWLSAEHGVDGWWAQELTVGYEMATGRRQPGQRPEGFSVTASRTVAVPVPLLFAAWADDEARRAWLPEVPLRLRTATAHRTARFDVEGGGTRLVLGFTDKGPAKSSVALEHERLPDAEAAAERKAFWRERLAVLQRHLER